MDTFPGGVQFDFSGYRVLVTGGTHGIGAAVAAAYRDAGAIVTITGTRGSPAEYEQDLSGFDYLPMVATDSDSVDAVAAATEAVDILINNAGTALPGGRDEYDPAVFEDAVKINLTSNYRLAAGLRSRLAESAVPGGASIISMTSLSSLFGIEIVPGYGSAKTGLVGLTRVLAVRYASDNIRVNAVTCGLIHTKMTTAMVDTPGATDPHLARTPLARLGETDDVTGPTLFLTSAMASYITGQCLVVDGGYSVLG